MKKQVDEKSWWIDEKSEVCGLMKKWVDEKSWWIDEKVKVCGLKNDEKMNFTFNDWEREL